jgi:hypothetical protein
MKIVWITGKNDLQFASFRLRCWYFHQELLKQGVSSSIYRRGRFPKADVVIFQKVFSERFLRLAFELKSQGTRLVYNLSDIAPPGTVNFAGTIQLLSIADHVIACSRFLGESFVNRYNPGWSVVEDPYDFCLPIPPVVSQGRQPAVFWHGFIKNKRLFIDPLQANLGFSVFTWTDQSQPPWSLKDLPKVMSRYEIGFAPLPLENILVYGKSSNKVVGYMAAGLAVIASDHPAYRELIVSNENGFLGRTTGDFNAAYEKLRDPVLRQAVSQGGYETVLPNYSIETLTKKLLETLEAKKVNSYGSAINSTSPQIP